MNSKKNQKKFDHTYYLKKRWQFLQFFGKSEVIKLNECIIYRIPNSLGHFRLGITIKAKANQPQRNKVKRQIRTVFKMMDPFLGSFDYHVVIPLKINIKHPYSGVLKNTLLKRFNPSK